MGDTNNLSCNMHKCIMDQIYIPSKEGSFTILNQDIGLDTRPCEETGCQNSPPQIAYGGFKNDTHLFWNRKKKKKDLDLKMTDSKS
jgi:hypothetical protein